MFVLLAAKRSLDAAIRCIFGAEPSDLSLLYFLTYVAAAGGLDPLISSRRNHGGQELRVVVCLYCQIIICSF